MNFIKIKKNCLFFYEISKINNNKIYYFLIIILNNIKILIKINIK